MTTARQAMADAITEADLLAAVIELAERLGWKVVHFRPAMNRSGQWSTAMSGTWAKGFPDLVMVHPGWAALRFVELKAAAGRLSPVQKDWQHWLNMAITDYRVWTPMDWVTGEIERALRLG